MFANDDGV